MREVVLGALCWGHGRRLWQWDSGEVVLWVLLLNADDWILHECALEFNRLLLLLLLFEACAMSGL